MNCLLIPGRWNRHGRAIADPQACELDLTLDAHSRTFGPSPRAEGRRFKVGMFAAVLLVALGSAAYLGADGHTSVLLVVR